MPRLRHKGTGLVAVVDSGRASRLGSDWVPVEAEKPKPAPSTRRRKNVTDDE